MLIETTVSHEEVFAARVERMNSFQYRFLKMIYEAAKSYNFEKLASEVSAAIGRPMSKQRLINILNPDYDDTLSLSNFFAIIEFVQNRVIFGAMANHYGYTEGHLVNVPHVHKPRSESRLNLIQIIADIQPVLLRDESDDSAMLHKLADISTAIDTLRNSIYGGD